MDFINLFTEETGKELPERIKQFFVKGQYNSLVGKDVVKPFRDLLEDNGVEYKSAKLEIDEEKMVMLSGWLNDEGYYSDDTHVPIFTVKRQNTVCVAMNVEDPEGNVYFFDKDSGFIDLEVTLDEFLKKV